MNVLSNIGVRRGKTVAGMLPVMALCCVERFGMISKAKRRTPDAVYGSPGPRGDECML